MCFIGNKKKKKEKKKKRKREREMSKSKIKRNYGSPVWISLTLEQHKPQQRSRRIYGRVGRDAYI
jgi:hypothetical protein